MDYILDCIFREKPDVLIVDSVQTMYNPEIQSTPGNTAQIKDVTTVLMKVAKENSISVFVVGHVIISGGMGRDSQAHTAVRAAKRLASTIYRTFFIYFPPCKYL